MPPSKRTSVTQRSWPIARGGELIATDIRFCPRCGARWPAGALRCSGCDWLSAVPPRPPLEEMPAATREQLLDFAMECRSYPDRTLLERFRAGPEALPTRDHFYFISDEAQRRGLAPDRTLTPEERLRLRPDLNLDELEHLLRRLRPEDRTALLELCSVDPAAAWLDCLSGPATWGGPQAFRAVRGRPQFDDPELQQLWNLVELPRHGAA